jgi:GTP-binding protein
MAKPIVALVGRPNVGKSTLFNRIVGERVAIVEDVAGTTRDRLYYDTDWNGRAFTVVDTGGMEIEPGSDLANRVRQQAELAVREADVVVFLVDGRQGVTPGDEEVAQLLRQSSKPVILAVNKADTVAQLASSAEFYRLGLPEVFSISALHGTGTGDLLDAIVAVFPPQPPAEPEVGEHLLRVALVGRPNVGKSSLVNALAGSERSIVHDVPGTTRDAIDTEIEIEGKKLILVDTAGVRKRGRIERGIEQFSVLRSVRAIEQADVVGVVIDAAEGVTAQDTHLAGFAVSAAKGLALVVNKWDLVPAGRGAREEFLAQIRSDFKFAPYAPTLFVSARNHSHVDDIATTAFQIFGERQKRVPTAALNDLVAEAVHAHGPSSDRGRTLKVFYVTQAAVNPPTFVFFVNDPELLHFSYQRYLENRLREAFGFDGTAIRLVFRAREGERIAARGRK